MDDIVTNKAKGELRIQGKRLVALDAEALCRHLDALVGRTVSEVIIRNHEFHLGKEDAERYRKENPKASLEQILERVKTSDRLGGFGLSEFTIKQDKSVLVEIGNPCVKETSGAASALLFGYCCGLFSYYFGLEYDAVDVRFNEQKNIVSARLLPRS